MEGPLGLTKINPTVNAFWQGLGGYYRLGTWDIADNSGKKRGQYDYLNRFKSTNI